MSAMRCGVQEPVALERVERVAGVEHVLFGALARRLARHHVPGALPARHGREDRARVHAVHADAVRRVLEGERLHDADDAELRGAVVHVVRAGLESVDRRGHHDRAAALLHHVRQHRLRGLPDAGEVDGDHVVPLLVGELVGGRQREDAGVGDEDVDLAELGDALRAPRRRGRPACARRPRRRRRGGRAPRPGATVSSKSACCAIG